MRPLILIIIFLLLVGCKQRSPEFFESENGLHGLKIGPNVIVEPKFHLVSNFIGCCAYAADDSGWVAIGRDGKVLFRPFAFDNSPDAFRDNRARYVENGLIGFYDSSFKVRIPAKYGYAQPFKRGMSKFCFSCKVNRDGEHYSVFSENWGLIDTGGNIILSPEYDEIVGYENGIYVLVENGDTTKLVDPRKANPGMSTAQPGGR